MSDSPPADIEATLIPDPDDECVHHWSRRGIPACEPCWSDRRDRERYSEAMRRGGPHRLYVALVAPSSPESRG